ncbi:hypothetical protein ACSBR2_017606 [Camellia fascicularis]
MVWWEAVLSPALQVLFDKLASGDILNLLKGWNIDELLLDKLKIAYVTNTAVVDDAEEKQYNNLAVETWLGMLKHAVYEAEDTLDDLATEALRFKLESNSQTIADQVRNLKFPSFNPFSERMESKIEKLIEKLEFIAKQKDVLGLKSDHEGTFRIMTRVPTTPLLIESHVYGRDDDKEAIIKLLVADDETTSNNEFCVIPIVGMGGLGKTTLAQIVYNDKRMDDYFDVKAWACVSDDFNLISITKALLESATNKACDTMNLELLQSSLRKKLSKRKFLIVLDDIWNESYDNWNDLMIPLMVGDCGSKIVVTTRNKEVLSVMMNTLPIYQLKEMSEDACWSLFLRHAFGNRDSNAYPNLHAIGRKIVNKCKGLPLAAKTIGGLLGSKLDTDYWYEILISKVWDLPSKKNAILPALRLSYHHLPTNLKRCFAYCSIFPQDYEFDRKSLVLLWMAEGFLQQTDNFKSMEEVGSEYFDVLLSRSFFQVSTQNKSKYVMHDLINDLAQFVSRNICIRFEDKLEKNKQCEISEKARHFSYIRSKYDVVKKFELLCEVKWLRTFLPFAKPSGAEFCYLSKKVLHELLPKLRCLRVLSLSGYYITELPDSIGKLKHIRYLDLSWTEINSLPQSLNTLYNLQTLMLCECKLLIQLPKDIGKLINLRHLDISGSGITEMPLGIDNLVSLQTMPEFVVGATGSGIGELRNLAHIQGRLCISRLENVANAWDARRANLKDKQGLNEFTVEWSNNFDESRNDGVEFDILEMLQPHQKLKELLVKFYGGLRFPSWIGDPLFSVLVSLNLSDCQRCVSLPPLGQLPSLKRLYIKGMTGIKSLGVEFYGHGISSGIPFPSLQFLSFENMPEWEDWSCIGGNADFEGFPILSELYIETCPKLLKKLPECLPCLKKLVIHESQQLTSSLPRLPLLHELDLKGCDQALLSGLLDFSLLASLNIHNIPNLICLPEGLIRCLTELELLVIANCSELMYLTGSEVGLQHLTSLRHLVVQNCPLLVFLSKEEHQQLPGKLEYLELDSCLGLEKLPSALHNLISLRELTIKDCPRVASFPETALPLRLRGLAIRGCGLESLPESMIHSSNASLEYLNISGCYLLTSFPRGGELLPTTFKQLTVDHCPNLESLPTGMMHRSNMSLEVLEVFDCSSIMSFPRGQLPTTLKILTIWNCSNLESLADLMMQTISLESFRIGDCMNLKSLPNNLHKFRSLGYLEIDGCPGLASFPQGGLPTSSLKTVNIINCENLKSLPERMQSLTSLQELQLSNCPGILSFPDGGLPMNLVSLDIKDCKNMRSLSEWGLHRLTCLRKFSVYGGCSDLASFPEWLLPSTLTTLHVGRLSNLDSLSTWLWNLTSLEELKIKECHKLLSLPEEGLPPMLSCLEINDCPLLQQHCEQNWAKIDHIPCIVM